MVTNILKKKLIYVLTIFWICIIFSFSLQPSDKSEQVSDGVGQLIVEHSAPEVAEKFDSLSVIEWKSFYKFVRKCAHFIEFFILGILMSMSMRQNHVVHKKRIAFVLCAVVAIIDETIQLFVPGRAGLVTDVILDNCGSLAGICVFCVGMKFLCLKKV